MQAEDLRIASLSPRLARGELRATELLEHVLARVERLGPTFNPLCHVDAQAGMAAAEASDARRAEGKALGPLDGIPLHIKDNIFLKGMPATWGSRLHAGFMPSEDDWICERLRGAGAVLFAKSNTPECALAGVTSNDLFGQTLNPYDASRIPGGSSGGAVCAAMLGLGLGGIATDAGGSIRRPCGYSGATGLRTSPGSIRRKLGFPATVNDFQTIGPVAADLADLEILFAAVRATAPQVVAEREARRIVLILEAGLEHIAPEVETATRVAASIFSRLGYQVGEARAPWRREDVEQVFRVMSSAGAARIAASHDPARWEALATAGIRETAKAGAALSAIEYVRVLDIVSVLRTRAAEWFDGRTIWLMPTSPCTAWKAGEAYPPEIAGYAAGPRDSTVYAPVVNAMAATGLALPAGFDAAGLPIGLQLVAGGGQEDLVLAAGRDLAREIGPLPPPEAARLEQGA